MIKHVRFFLLFLALTAPVCFGQPASQPKEKTPKNVSGSREQLKQMVADLQKDPNNRELREKIIKLALTLKPKPVVPPEAKRPFMKAVTFQKEATSPADYAAAIKAYQEALILAPWWGEAYYNLAVAQESVSRFDDAMASLKLYLLTGPKDSEEAENRIYALEAKKEKAARDAAAAAETEKPSAERTIVGIWRHYNKDKAPISGAGGGTNSWHLRIEVQGDLVVMTQVWEVDNSIWKPPILKGDERRYASFKLEGRRLTAVCRFHGASCHWTDYFNRGTYGVISEDFREIVITTDANHHFRDLFKEYGESGGIDAVLIKER